MRYAITRRQSDGEGQLQEVPRLARHQHQRRALLHPLLLDEHLQEAGENNILPKWGLLWPTLTSRSVGFGVAPIWCAPLYVVKMFKNEATILRH